MTQVVADKERCSPEEGARVYAADRAHVFHSWSAQAHVNPMVIARAEGSYVWDYDGRSYLDFSSQLVNTNLGHQHPKVLAGIRAQVDRLCTIAPHHANDMRGEAARLICELAPRGLEKVFFTNAGAEAVEHAVRMARLHTGRIKVLSAYRSYHGATSTAANLTGDSRRLGSDYGSAGVVHFFGPFLYRSAFQSSTEEEESKRALEHLEQVILLEGPRTIAAVILESVPGSVGIMPPPAGYLAGVRELCDRHGLVFIADEVMAGFGRTGSWFAFEHYGVVPDLITFSKGVNSGYVPLGGVIISDAVAASFAERRLPWRTHLFWTPPRLCIGCGHDQCHERGTRCRERGLHRRRGACTRTRRTREEAPVGRRSAWPWSFLGGRAREEQDHPRANRPLRRHESRDDRAHGCLQETGTPAADRGQPGARSTAVHRERGGSEARHRAFG